MAFEFLRRWGRGWVPIQQPPIAEVRLQEVLDQFRCPPSICEIGIPCLRGPLVTSDQIASLSPEVTPDLAWLEAKLFPYDLGLAGIYPQLAHLSFVKLQAPGCRDVPTVALWVVPGILDIFTGLRYPGRAGKAYGESEGISSNANPENQLPADRRSPPPEFSKPRCRHGLPIGSCEICQTEADRFTRHSSGQSSTKARIRTADVFDLLLPYLQPPLEALLAQPVLFPPGRRPYPYQIAGIQFLSERKGALLGDEMGLGKSIQTIVALQLLFRHGKIRIVLILCPRSLLGTWEREIHKWAPELFVLKIRGMREERRGLWASPASVYLTTYETLREDTDQGMDLRHKFDIVVLDEAQKIKNPSAGLSRAVHKVEAGYRWGLSGTPLENQVEDVIAILHTVISCAFSKV